MEHTQLTALIELCIKFDTLLNLKRNKPVKGIPTEPVLNCRNPNHIWSIEFVDNLFLIKYHYDKDFAEVIKGSYSCPIYVRMEWNKKLLGWVAHKDFHEKMFLRINLNFPEWECIDKR